MRALGGAHFARGEWADAAACLRRAVAIGPLVVRAWFILGCACMRLEDWEGGRDAFARCVALDEEEVESWNNLARMYLRMGARKRVGGAAPADDGDGDGDEEEEEEKVRFLLLLYPPRTLTCLQPQPTEPNTTTTTIGVGVHARYHGMPCTRTPRAMRRLHEQAPRRRLRATRSVAVIQRP